MTAFMCPSIFPCLFFCVILLSLTEIYFLKNILTYFRWRIWLHPISFDGKSFKNVAGSGRVPAAPWANTRSKQQPWTHWLVVIALFLTNIKPNITICFKFFFTINRSWILNNLLLPPTSWGKLPWSFLASWMEPSWRLQLQLH